MGSSGVEEIIRLTTSEPGTEARHIPRIHETGGDQVAVCGRLVKTRGCCARVEVAHKDDLEVGVGETCQHLIRLSDLDERGESLQVGGHKTERPPSYSYIDGCPAAR